MTKRDRRRRCCHGWCRSTWARSNRFGIEPGRKISLQEREHRPAFRKRRGFGGHKSERCQQAADQTKRDSQQETRIETPRLVRMVLLHLVAGCLPSLN